MAKLTDLPETEQVEKVREAFLEILSVLAEDQSKISEYVPVPAKPAAPSASATEAEKNAIAKQLAEFEAKTGQVAKIKEILSKVEKPEGCFCGGCATVKFGSSIPQELEPIIDAAQEKASKANY